MTIPTGDEELPRALPSIPVGSPGDRLLRESLAILRDRTDDRETRDGLTAIIEGRRPALDLLDMPGFEAVVTPGVAAFDEQWSVMTDEEKAQAAREGQGLFDQESPSSGNPAR